MSFWLPGHLTWTMVRGVRGFFTSMIENPS